MKSFISVCFLFLIITFSSFAQNNFPVTDAVSTDFLTACDKDDIGLVKNILSRDDVLSFINLGDAEGHTALMIASEKGYVNIVDMILSKDCDVDATCIHGKTALMYASENGYVDIVASLLAGKANPNVQINGGMTSLIQASGRGHYQIVSLLLNSGANAEMNGMYMEGVGQNVLILADMTPLMVASYNNHFEICSLLISKNAMTDTINEYGSSALLYAIGRKNNLVAFKLMEYKSDVNMAGVYKTYSNITPLALACALGNYELISPLFIAKSDVSKKMADGRTALMWAVIGGNINIVRDILSKKPNVNDKDGEGKTPLMYAAEFGRVEIAKLLITNKANISETDIGGKNALKYAMENGYSETVAFLNQETLQ